MNWFSAKVFSEDERCMISRCLLLPGGRLGSSPLRPREALRSIKPIDFIGQIYRLESRGNALSPVSLALSACDQET
jgi:hypothetical protein